MIAQTDPATALEALATQRQRPPRARSAYWDAADSNRLTSAYFSPASTSDINSLVTGDRKTLVQRCRYQRAAADPIAGGVVDTLADYVVGPGPSLQVIAGDEIARDLAQAIEADWSRWSQSLDLAGQHDLGSLLRLVISSCSDSGELFVADSGASAGRGAISYRLSIIDPDRVETPGYGSADGAMVEGIEHDPKTGRPIRYHVLTRDPAFDLASLPGDTISVAAADMVHFFVPIRPGQARGIPWMAPALTAFAFAARWKQATVLAAEHAANQALVWYSEDDDGRDPDSEWAGDEIETAAGVQVTAARGWKPMQVDAKHPNAQFEMLRRAMYGDAGRWAAMPHNMVLLDSADHNYASGRLDAQPFYRANLRRRAWLESIGLNHWFARWYSEARRARPWGRQAPVEPPEIRWDWPGYRHVDPLKEASAQSIRLRSGTTNLTTECAEEGHDAMEILATRARELAEIQRLANEYGLSPQMVDLLATGQASTSAEGGTQHGPADSNMEDDE